ncbi:MAG TPA: hypothetical protein VGU45_05020 [Microvirga sp.]|jgi:hypothetical protein|nr:hypothetical protein [Microvirga sp.]
MAIFTAIAGAVVGALGIAGAIGTALTSVIAGALAIGASVAVQALTAKKPGDPRSTSGPTPAAQVVLNQTTGPRVRGYGRAKLGGTRAFWDSREGRLYQVLMQHSGQIDAYETFFAGDLQLGIDGSGNNTAAPINDYLYLSSHTGDPNQGAASLMLNNWSDVWTTAHRLRGIAYLVTVFRSPGQETFSEKYPEGAMTPIRAIMRLSRVWDPRVSAQDPNDEATWAWSDNPALCILDYLRHPDGYRRSLADIDVPSFSAFASLCDQPIPLAAGGTEKRYRLWGIYSLTEDPSDVLRRMLATCDGELYQTHEGRIALRGGVWTPPTVMITEGEVLSHQLEQGNNRFGAFNELKIIYTSPLHDYQAMEAIPWIDLADQAERGVLQDDLTLDLVPSATQARRLAKIHTRKLNPRWRGTVRVAFGPGIDALGERTIRLVLPELQIDDAFQITRFSMAPDLTAVEMDVVTLGEEAYTWNPAIEERETPPIPQETTPDLTFPVPQTLTPTKVGSTIRVTVANPGRDDLTLHAQYRAGAGAVWQDMALVEGQYAAVSPNLAAGSYDVRARWRAAQQVAGEWTAIQSITI